MLAPPSLGALTTSNCVQDQQTTVQSEDFAIVSYTPYVTVKSSQARPEICNATLLMMNMQRRRYPDVPVLSHTSSFTTVSTSP